MIEMSRRIVGVDGGGSKTRVVVVDEDLKVHGRADGGSTNWNSVGKSQARETLQNLLRSVDMSNVTEVVLGMACVDSADDKLLLNGWVLELFPSITVYVHSDAIIALSSGTRGVLRGITVISGTGSIVYGRNSSGVETRNMGWGPMFGDKGNGYSIGAGLLTGIAAAHDSRIKSTPLFNRAMERVGVSNLEGLIGWAYADQSWSRIADLAPLVLEAAESGDEFAAQLVDKEVDLLVEAIAVVHDRLNLADEDRFVVTCGGLFGHKYYAETFARSLKRRISSMGIRSPTVSAEVAAAALASTAEGRSDMLRLSLL